VPPILSTSTTHHSYINSRQINHAVYQRRLVGAYARGPAFSWVHCQHMVSIVSDDVSISHGALYTAENQRVGKPDVDLFIARTDTNQPAKVTVPS